MESLLNILAHSFSTLCQKSTFIRWQGSCGCGMSGTGTDHSPTRSGGLAAARQARCGQREPHASTRTPCRMTDRCSHRGAALPPSMPCAFHRSSREPQRSAAAPAAAPLRWSEAGGTSLCVAARQLLSVTVAVTPVLAVLPATISRNGTPNTASGRAYTAPTAVEGTSVMSATEPSAL